MAWQKLDTTTLGGTADTITLNGTGSGFTAKKFLQLLINTFDSGTTTHGIRFNNDSGSNYSRRRSTNGAADGTNVSQTEIQVRDAGTTPVKFTVVDAINISAQEKLVISHHVDNEAAGAGSAPNRQEVVGKWANTSAQITREDTQNVSTGDYLTDSITSLLGTD